MNIKISQLEAVSNVGSQDLIMISQNSGGIYDSKKITTGGLFSGWEDLTAPMLAKTTGTAVPDWSQIGTTNFWGYNFLGTGNQLKELRANFHIDHRYFPGSDMYIHTHWLPNTTGAGNVKWYWNIAYAKGYNQAAFNLVSTINVSVTTAAPGIQYQHMISEVQFSNDGGTGGLLDSNSLETDGVIMVRFYRDPTDVADTYEETAWGLFCDIHFQANRFATPNRNYPFGIS